MALNDSDAIALSLSQPEQFVLVFDRHGSAVHAYLARRSGYQSAEDLSAEVWLRAFRSRHSYDMAWSDARPWLYGIARNTLRSYWRLRSPVRTVPTEPAHDPWPNVDDRLDAVSQRSNLRAALAQLPAADREVLLLVAWEQLTAAEIAIALEVPAGTVRWRLHRARRMLTDPPGEPNDDSTSVALTKES